MSALHHLFSRLRRSRIRNNIAANLPEPLRLQARVHREMVRSFASADQATVEQLARQQITRRNTKANGISYSPRVLAQDTMSTILWLCVCQSLIRKCLRREIQTIVRLDWSRSTVPVTFGLLFRTLHSSKSFASLLSDHRPAATFDWRGSSIGLVDQ